MIDKVHIVKILNKHFIEICEIQPGIFRASQRFRNRDYAFHYFDLTAHLHLNRKNQKMKYLPVWE